MKSRMLVAFLASALPLLAAAQIYTWKDASGRTHFSDQPPSSGKIQTVRGGIINDLPEATASVPVATASGVPGAAASAPKSWQERDKEFQQRQTDKAEAEAKAKKEEDLRKQKAAACADQQRNIALLERGGRIGRANEKGETIALSDNEISSELASARKRYASECR